MARAVERLPTIDRRQCRDDAERRFSQHALVTAYENLYVEVSRSLTGVAL
jgi:hypothetical protein